MTENNIESIRSWINELPKDRDSYEFLVKVIINEIGSVNLPVTASIFFTYCSAEDSLRREDGSEQTNYNEFYFIMLREQAIDILKKYS